MWLPTRLVTALRRGAAPGIVAAAVASAALFAATPFVVGEVARHYDVGLGTAGVMSTVQVGAFAATTFVVGRRLTPHPRWIRVGAVLMVVANALGVTPPDYAWFLAARAMAGVGAGLFAWMAWTDAMRHTASMRDVAAAGPITALVSSPLFGALVDGTGVTGAFAAIAVASLPALILPAGLDGGRLRAKQVSPSRSNRVLLVALGLLTLAGSALFVFGSELAGARLGLSPTTAALAYSLNALGGWWGTRFRARPGTGGLWLLGTALSALAAGLAPHPVVFFAAFAFWGFAFWMGVPEVLRLLAARSYAPDERSGDAQSAMAVGRAIGPFLGGTLVGDGAFTRLTVFAAAGLSTAALTVSAVERYRATAPPLEPAG